MKKIVDMLKNGPPEWLVAGTRGPELRAAEPDELQDLSQRGWRLVGAIETSRHEKLYEYVPNNAARYGEFGHDGRTLPAGMSEVTKSVMAPHTILMLARDPESWQSELHAVNENLRKDAVASSAREQELIASCDALSEELQESTRTLRDAKEQLAKLLKRYEARDDAAHRMERDLGKIRSAIGDLRVREILGEEKPLTTKT